MAAVAIADGEDRISALPDDALHHILSFLPSDDAVRTSVLAGRWRHLWKSTPALRVTPRSYRDDGRRPWTAPALISFINHLLLLRGAAPVEACEIICEELGADSVETDDGELPIDFRYRLDEELNQAACLWIRHALAICHARELRVWLKNRRRVCLDGAHFASPNLTSVELTDAAFVYRAVDFSRCPALKRLTMSRCKIHAGRIWSPSLACLSIDGCNFDDKNRTRFSTPRLVSLELHVGSGKAPFLEKMPMLEEANVRLDDWSDDMCTHNVCKHGGYRWEGIKGSRDSCYCIDANGKGMYLENMISCSSCYGDDDGSSVLLEGLSGAKDLQLISDPHVFIFRKDCKSHTTFNNLKTLVLNEWCMAVDFSALVFFLRCSPVLEELTLQLGNCETRHPVVKTGKSYKTMEQLFVASQQLMKVEIQCMNENDLVEKLLMLLTTNGVPREKIYIEQNFYPPDFYGYYSDSEYGDYY